MSLLMHRYKWSPQSIRKNRLKKFWKDKHQLFNFLTRYQDSRHQSYPWRTSSLSTQHSSIKGLKQYYKKSRLLKNPSIKSQKLLNFKQSYLQKHRLRKFWKDKHQLFNFLTRYQDSKHQSYPWRTKSLLTRHSSIKGLKQYYKKSRLLKNSNIKSQKLLNLNHSYLQKHKFKKYWKGKLRSSNFLTKYQDSRLQLYP